MLPDLRRRDVYVVLRQYLRSVCRAVGTANIASDLQPVGNSDGADGPADASGDTDAAANVEAIDESYEQAVESAHSVADGSEPKANVDANDDSMVSRLCEPGTPPAVQASDRRHRSEPIRLLPQE